MTGSAEDLDVQIFQAIIDKTIRMMRFYANETLQDIADSQSSPHMFRDIARAILDSRKKEE